MVERRFFGAFRGWWCCMFPGPSPWPIGHQFVGWGVIKKKIEIPTTLAQQALTLSTTFWEIMTRELHYQQSKQSKITLPVSNSFTADWSIQKWNFGFILHLRESKRGRGSYLEDRPWCLVKFLFKKRKLSALFTYLFQSYIWLLSIGHDSNMGWMIESCPYQTKILRNRQDSIRSKTFLQNHS